MTEQPPTAIAKIAAIARLLHRMSEADIDRIHAFAEGIAQSRQNKGIKRRQRWPKPTQSFNIQE